MKIIFDVIKEKRKELVLFSIMSVTTSIILYLFDIRMEVFIVITLLYLLASIYCMTINLSIYWKENDLKEELRQFKEELRQENENNIGYRNQLNDYFLTWIHQVKTQITSLNLLAESLEEENREKLKIISMSIESYTEMTLTYLKLMDFSPDMDIKRVELSLVVKNC